MALDTVTEVYRIRPSNLSCRSARELLTITLREIPGTEAVSVTDDGTIVVLGRLGTDLRDALVRAVVAAGFDPGTVRIAQVEHALDPSSLTFEEARGLGLVSEPKEPVRAEVQQVQRVRVHVTDGYDPDTILVSAGIPVEIEFSEGHGCLGRVLFEQFGIDEDLESGGATVRIPALEPGTYPFSCGMHMVHGTLIAE
ncbi:MAG: hypothetical protein C0418_04575 [Coriobacteriaceae bacterium]|nr:hypothetical protein [Coriobacteriaceae bacterium]